MKKLNKLVAILVAMAMMLTLGVVSAFAVNKLDGDATKSANPLIEKKSQCCKWCYTSEIRLPV